MAAFSLSKSCSLHLLFILCLCSSYRHSVYLLVSRFLTTFSLFSAHRSLLFLVQGALIIHSFCIDFLASELSTGAWWVITLHLNIHFWHSQSHTRKLEHAHIAAVQWGNGDVCINIDAGGSCQVTKSRFSAHHTVMVTKTSKYKWVKMNSWRNKSLKTLLTMIFKYSLSFKGFF